MSSDMDRVIERVRKLIALATSPNEHEATLAMEKAQALLAEYNLSMADVGDVKSQSEEIIIDGALRSSSLPWRRPLAIAVAMLYFCRYFFGYVKERTTKRSCGYIRHDQHYFVGQKHNVAVAKLMFTYLCEAIERLAEQGALNVSKNKSAYITAFRDACVARLRLRIMERMADAKLGNIKAIGGGNLPALADLYSQAEQKLSGVMNQLKDDLKAHQRRGGSDDERGLHDGDEAGKKISLDAQVGHDKQKALTR